MDQLRLALGRQAIVLRLSGSSIRGASGQSQQNGQNAAMHTPSHDWRTGWRKRPAGLPSATPARNKQITDFMLADFKRITAPAP
jgi:hypothetical protein